MHRIPSKLARLALACLVAVVGTLALHADEPSFGLGPSAGPAPAPLQVYDLHWLRLTATDGHALLSGIGVRSSLGEAETALDGTAAVKIAGGPIVPLTLVDFNGVELTGHVVIPETQAEGLDALIVVDGATGTFEAIVAGEVGPERQDLEQALAQLEAYWIGHGFKEDRPISATFQVPRVRADVDLTQPARRTGARALPGSNDEFTAGSVLDGPDGLPGAGARFPASKGFRLGEGRLAAAASSLIDPTDEFQKQGYELLSALGFVEDDRLIADVAAVHGELLEAATLDSYDEIVLGAELLRQGASLDDATANEIQQGMDELGIGVGSVASADVAADVPEGQLSFDRRVERTLVPAVVDSTPDNTPAECTSILANGAPHDQGIDPAADLDYWCFNLACGDTVAIETGPIVVGGTGDTHLELYDPDGLLIASDDDGAATSLWSLINTVADKTGSHVLKVRGFSNTTVVANYRLTVNATAGVCDPTLDGAEPNNTSATCSPKASDGSYSSHWLRPLGDEDWFCFDVAACGSPITIDVNEPGDVDILARFQVFNPAGVEILNSTATTATTVTAFSAGTFRLRVTGGSTPGTVPTHQNSTDQNTGQYDISVLVGVPTAPCDAFEPDSEQVQCNSLPIDGTSVLGHSISPTGDEDWYCFDLACNDNLTVVLTPTPAGGTTSLRGRVELWGPTSTAAVLGVSAATNGATVTLTRASNHAGHWYVRILRASTVAGAAQTGTYNLSATRSGGPSDPLCDGDEPDSSADQCRAAIGLAGELETKALFPGRDEDFICIGSLLCGDTVTVETFATPPANLATNTTVDIYRLPNTTTAVATNTDKVAGNVFSRAVYSVTTPAQAGTYVARVRGSLTTTTGQYDVGVTVVNGDCPEPDDFEPDNTTAQCNAFTANGAPVPGHNIFPVGDTDFFCVDLACGENLSITVTPTGGSLRPIVALFNASGVQVGTATAPSNGAPITLSTTDNDAGIHGIRVTSSTSTTGNYTISATKSPGTCLFDPFEPDNTAAACRFLGTPVNESRALNPATDSDFTCIILNCGDGVVVTVTPTNGTLRAIVRLDGPTGTNLGTATATAPGAPVTLTDAVSASGVYNIEVDSSTSTRGLYDISITTFAAFDCIDAYEPDNTRDACQPIATDGSLQVHTLLIHPDEDWVCFDVVECGSRVTVGTQTTNPSYDDADTTVQLYDPNGVQVGSATTGGPASHGRLSMIVNQAGTYAARIIPASTTATSTSGGQYDLSVSVVDVKKVLTVPPVAQTLLPAVTQLDAQALTQGSGYTVTEGTNPLIDISTTGTPLGADGLSAHTVPIPFTFTYYGNNYGAVTVQDNGLISFSDPTWIAGIGNECIPNATTPNDYVSIFWDDLQQGVGVAEVYTEVIGSAPDRIFITQWDRNPIPGGTLVTLQGLLYEGSNDIEFRYGTMTGPDADGNTATIGIENPDGTDGIQVACNGSRTWSGASFLFSANNGLVDYPLASNCFSPYEVAVDTAPFIDISSTGTAIGPLTDDSFTTVPMPILFPYFGAFESLLNIGSNGFVNFGTGSTALTNQCPLPSATAPNGVLAPFWDDLNPSTGGAIYTQLFGVPGSGSAFFVVQYDKIPFFSVAGSANTFEVILHEDGRIEFRYGPMTASSRGTGDSATIGIEDRTGTSAAMHSCNLVSSIQPGMRVRFLLVDPPARFTWLDTASNVLGTGPTYLHPIDGPCEVVLRVEVRDPASCCVLTEDQLVTIADRAAPTITSQPKLGADGCIVLWPPNHGYTEFTIEDTGIAAFDACNGVSMRFAAVSSSQPEDAGGLGDGGSDDDVMISPDGRRVALRPERNGNCGQLDRTYTLHVEVSDAVGNTRLSDAFNVCVYHDQGHRPPGPYVGAAPGTDADTVLPGWTEGTYGTDCGAGCSMRCDPTQDIP